MADELKLAKRARLMERAAFEAETIVVLATLLVLVVPIWNVITALLVRNAIALSLNLYLVNPQPKPLKAQVINGAGIEGLAASVSALSSAEAISYLGEMNQNLLASVKDLGFPMKQAKIVIASRLVYLNIDQSTGMITSIGGEYYSVAGSNTILGQFNSSCINNNLAAATSNFDSYISQKLDVLDPNTYSKAIGTRLIDSLGVSGSGEYLPLRAINFVMFLVCPPSLWSTPVTENAFIVSSKEVGVY